MKCITCEESMARINAIICYYSMCIYDRCDDEN